MGAIKIPTNFNIELEFEIPEFYRRFFSLLIDMTVEFFYCRIIIEILQSIESASSYDADSGQDINSLALILFLPILIYHVALEITMNGQSFGKKLMRLRVVDEGGGRASISQFIIRWLLRVSDVWLIVLLFALIALDSQKDMETIVIILLVVGFLLTDVILVISSRKGQRIGDMLAHTILIRTNTKANIEETVFQEVADNYVPSYPEIMRLSDRDINSIKSILQTARKKGDFQMAANASEKIKAHLKIDSALSPFDFLEILLKDYNYLSTK